MGGIGLFEFLILIGVAMLIFGPKKIGEFTRSVGEGVKSFKDGMNEGAPGADGEPRPPEVEVKVLPPRDEDKTS
jgi:sec-independent protein translocase protein TatA